MSQALSDIGGLIEDIIKPIEKVLESIAHVLDQVIGEIASIIGQVLRDIGNWIIHHWTLLAILLIIVIIVLAIFAPEVLIAIWAAVESAFAAAYAFVAEWIDWIVTGFSVAAKWVMSTWAAYIQPSLQYLSDLSSAAQVVADLRQGQYGKAFVDLFQYFDAKDAKRIKGVISTVTSDINDLRSKLTHAVSQIVVDVDTIDSQLGQAQISLEKIGKAFGVKAITDIGEALGQFRHDVLSRIEQAGAKAEQDITSAFNTLVNPFTQVISLFAGAEYNAEVMHNLFSAFSLKGIHAQIPVHTPSTLTPRFTLPPLKGYQLTHGGG